jgi:hypothetical protein
MKRTGDIASLF